MLSDAAAVSAIDAADHPSVVRTAAASNVQTLTPLGADGNQIYESHDMTADNKTLLVKLVPDGESVCLGDTCRESERGVSGQPSVASEVTSTVAGNRVDGVRSGRHRRENTEIESLHQIHGQSISPAWMYGL